MGTSAYFTTSRCLQDLSDAKEEHWNHHYNFISGDVSAPRVKEWTSADTGWTIGMSVSLFLTGLAIVYYSLSKYYYWGFGMQIGYFVSNLIVAIDYWGDYGVFHPESAHERYLPEDDH